MPVSKLWDAHAHIQQPWFSENEINDIIKNATNSNIEGIINVISSPKKFDYEQGIQLASKYNIIHTNFGLQPTESTVENFSLFKKSVESSLNEDTNSICAIGEVGLDYHWVKDKKLLELQNTIFKEIIAFTNELNLPLVIHSRKAEDDCLILLEKHSEVPVLLHGIEASFEQIKILTDLNYMISIPTSVCNRKKYRKIAKRIPIENILLETDSPFQLPFNQSSDEKRIKNEPMNISHSAKKIGEIKDMDYSEVAKITSTNTKNFFSL